MVSPANEFDIVVCTGQRAGATVRVPDDGLEIGRRDGTGLVLSDPEVSQLHARLVPDGTGGLALEDLGSRNGTFVGGKRVKTARLAPGDIVAFGTTLVEVRAARPQETREGVPHTTLMMSTAPVLGQVVAESVAPERRGAVLAGLYHLGVALVTGETPRRILSYGKQLFRDTFHGEVRHEVAPEAAGLAAAARETGGAASGSGDAASPPPFTAARIRSGPSGPELQVPLRHGDRFIGTFHVTLKPSETPCDTRTLAVADALGAHVAGALASVLTREEMESSRRELARELTAQSRVLDRAHHSLQRAEKRVIEAERMAAIAQLAAAVAHEVNNPLAFLTANLDALASGREESRKAGTTPEALARQRQIRQDEGEILEECREGARRIQGFVRRLQIIWETGNAPHGPVIVRELIAETLKTLRRELKDGVQLDAMLDGPDVEIEASAAGLVQVVRNLVSNMCQAAEEGGGADRRVAVKLRSTASGMELVVAGTAPAVPPSERARLFEPFSMGGGTETPGLGLWMSQQIVADHGGAIRYEERAEGGAAFVVTLPRTSGAFPVGEITNVALRVPEGRSV